MCVCTSISVSLRFSLFSISCPCSLRKVQRNRLRFWMKFCSSSLPFAYANRILVFKGSIFNTNKEESIRLAQKQQVLWELTLICTGEENTCLSCIMVRVKRLTNCSSYWLTLTPAISVKHFSVTLRNIGTFKNYRSTQKRRGANN